MSRLKFWITAGRHIKFNYTILIHSRHLMYILIFILNLLFCLPDVSSSGGPSKSVEAVQPTCYVTCGVAWALTVFSLQESI